MIPMFDPFLMILGVGIMLMMMAAQGYVKSTFYRFHEVPIRRRLTGAQAARAILDMNGLQHVAVERVHGELTDHYDPQDKVLRLSDVVYNSPSLSAVGVAAHEAGHAIQDKNNYFWLKFRQGIVPFVNFGTQVGMLLLMGGLMVLFSGGGTTLAAIGLVLYAAGAVFAIITLPVEFNASSRALAILNQSGMVGNDELSSTRKVLNAAALTYVAGAIAAITYLLYYAFLIFGGSREE